MKKPNKHITRLVKELYVADAKTIDTNRLKQSIDLNLSKQPAVSENVLIIERDGKSL